jgi:hypothetical protein
MNTGIYHGSDALVYIRTDDDPETWTAIGHASSHDIDVKSELIVRRTKSTGEFPNRKLVGIDASVSIKALVLYDGYSFKDLLTAQLAGTALLMRLRGHEIETWGVREAAGDWYLELTALVSGNNKSMPLNEDGSYTCNFELDGEISIEIAAT